MREILFRGKQNGKWVYGSLMSPTRLFSWFSIEDSYNKTHHHIAPETIGQFTGLTDSNGTRIFEGDIVMVAAGTLFRIEYNNAKFCMCNDNVESELRNSIKVIGNIHDNPELLGGKINA